MPYTLCRFTNIYAKFIEIEQCMLKLQLKCHFMPITPKLGALKKAVVCPSVPSSKMVHFTTEHWRNPVRDVKLPMQRGHIVTRSGQNVPEAKKPCIVNISKTLAMQRGHMATRSGQNVPEAKKLALSVSQRPGEIELWLLLYINRKLTSVHWVPFSAVTLLGGWEDQHLICNKTHSNYP